MWESEEFLHSHYPDFLPPHEGMLIIGSCFFLSLLLS
jgi:hypothetical protein